MMGGMNQKKDFPRLSGKPLRIALVTETWAPEINGVARTLGRLVDGLLAHGHTVELTRPRQGKGDISLATSQFEEIRLPGAPIPFYKGLHFGLPATGTLQQGWRSAPPDIVHIATEGPLGVSALKAARRLDLPVSTSLHTHFDAYSRHYRFGFLRGAISAHLKRFHNRADLTLVPTRMLAQQLMAAGYQRVEVLARGVDTTVFNPEQRSDALRQTWGVTPDTLVVAHVGRIAPEKNIGQVLDGFAAIRSRRSDARLLFVGDGPARRELQRRHPEHIYAGMRSGNDLAAHYASADMFLFPSLTETFGNVVLEALASGLPVVAYNHAAAADMIRDGQNGRLAAPGDAAGFASAAAGIASDPHSRIAMSRQAPGSITGCRWDRIQQQFSSVLRSTIAAHSGKREREAQFFMLPF